MIEDDNLRDAMIAAITPIALKADDGMGWTDPEEIADAILAILPHWTAEEPPAQ